ncbi:MAG: 30S ribosomal protein S20 [Alphaproteobacteria bacterium]|nr:30S ribosomal protein S20 [Alphaproteobacteria bacterium]
MANHKSALKSNKQAEKRTILNKARMSRIRTHLRYVEEAIASGSKEDAQVRFREMQSELMRGVRRNLFHINTAARKISRISSRIKSL